MGINTTDTQCPSNILVTSAGPEVHKAIVNDHKAGGTPSILPRKLRDEIYCVVIGQSHIIMMGCHLAGPIEESNAPERPALDRLSILQVSTSVNLKAMKLFYGESPFRRVTKFGVPCKDRSTSPSLMAATRMMKTELQFGYDRTRRG